jgi:hypothetical protein
VLRQLQRRQLGHADDRALAGGIGDVGRTDIAFAGDRGDVDDASAALGDHLLCDPLQAEEHALRVDAMDAIPIRLGDVHNVGAARHPGVVQQDVDAAKRRQRFTHHAVDLIQVADISLDRNGAMLA